jgi:dephospho-CoA kinase
VRIYGLTGGTGSGKSEAARRFAEHGIAIIDADAIGHEVIARDGVAEQQVIQEFGPEILTDGAIDRAKLGARVFRDETARKQLNAIVHPAIGMAIAMRCAALAEAGQPATIIDAALIAENGRKEDYLSGLIVVTCPVDVRIRRLVRHRGLDEAEARRRIAAQTPPENKLALADWVIDNSGTVHELHARVDAIAGELLNDAE